MQLAVWNRPSRTAMDHCQPCCEWLRLFQCKTLKRGLFYCPPRTISLWLYQRKIFTTQNPHPRTFSTGCSRLPIPSPDMRFDRIDKSADVSLAHYTITLQRPRVSLSVWRRADTPVGYATPGGTRGLDLVSFFRFCLHAERLPRDHWQQSRRGKGYNGSKAALPHAKIGWNEYLATYQSRLRPHML